ncbi:MHYT domain-containing protein [Streptomyces sp. AK02-01A]|uniref:MHYT domain-containing protein n=1 Tax=Streptomyces sp. AK02-01A TaxID=3028648 RepID=UPI0029B39C38|nr:MHYT domain-containing protein [Streptomyces sp. AK02-01A]MDX3851578.1 MHYT domain-containing protein [Streptomyces sp. AK02-01A]
MQGTIDGFSYGLVTPVAAFLMACLGGALGLRCAARYLRTRHPWKAGLLVLGAASIGSGVWTMHFIAMMGFAVSGTPVGYDRLTTFASLAVVIVMTGIGILIVGHRGATPMALVTGGTITGLSIATMHYLGMEGMRLHGRIEYDTVTVALSVMIAVAAAITALWVITSHRGFPASLGACLVMGVAATGMHYTGMAAVNIHPELPTGASGGVPAVELLAPMLIGPAVFLVLAGAVVLIDPLIVAGGPDSGPPVRAVTGRCRGAVPSQRMRPRPSSREPAGRTAVRSACRDSPDLRDR